MIKELGTRPQLLRIIANSGWMMGEQVLKLFGGLVIGVLIARHLGVDAFGKLGFALAYVGIFGIISTLGLNRIGMRELVAAGDDTVAVSRVENTILVMRMSIGFLLMPLAVFVAWVIGGVDLRLVLILSPICLFMAFDVVELHFQSMSQARKSSSARSISYLIVMLIRVVLLACGADLIAFGAAAMFEYLGAATALFIVFRANGNQFRPANFDPSLARRLVMESWPEIFASFAGILFIRLDQVMLGIMNGPHDVGIFAVASRLSEAWYFIPVALVTSTFPSIVRVRDINYQQYLNRIGHLMRALVAISYAAIAVTTISAHWIIVRLYGNQYAQSADVLVIHIWCGLFMSLGLASGSWIMAEKRVKLNLYRNICGAVVNITLNLILIPHYGPIGASISTLCSLFMAYMLFDFAVPSMWGISRRKWRAMVLMG